MGGPTVDPFKQDMNEVQAMSVRLEDFLLTARYPQQVDLGMEVLQEHCSRLMESVKILMKEGSEILQRPLKDSLGLLHKYENTFTTKHMF